jgi:hypothetical protein
MDRKLQHTESRRLGLFPSFLLLDMIVEEGTGIIFMLSEVWLHYTVGGA